MTDPAPMNLTERRWTKSQRAAARELEKKRRRPIVIGFQGCELPCPAQQERLSIDAAAAMLGLPMLTVKRTVRGHLEPGTDYVGRELTGCGQRRLLAVMGHDNPHAFDSDAPRLVVARVFGRNRRLVLAEKNGAPDSPPVRVRVVSNRNFAPGMFLNGCTPVAGCPGLYTYTGRLPRRRGVW